MLGAKFLLIPIVGGFGSIVGCTSISTQEWDPEYVWRVGSKKEFYLTTCKNRRTEEDDINSKWIYSDLQVYLIFKEGISTTTDGTELKLIGKGYHQKFSNTKPITPVVYNYREDLQQKINNDGGDNRFSLTVGELTGINWLGEGGGGVDSSEWGLRINCDKKLFTFNKDSGDTSSAMSSELSRMKFKLNKCGEESYRGVKGCLIEISNDGTNWAGHNKNLKWVDTFKPIVIQ
ncbi:hypothetical protein WEN_02600 [Mycoplasma wenyonii str. Massachusetts]|uniref:Lipoprotein n=1 Tax=Mycoplasma wenyonii (strain Massachusetts) TaxID=1197325 RepID=I6ZJD8_MYCWM|nr:hypothetical protein [Mycoplasma wenyonii]AFN65305.1 hypothetical protein WEN_02600 [Mycoplasma wenyonii str. Massachusetts]